MKRSVLAAFALLFAVLFALPAAAQPVPALEAQNDLGAYLFRVNTDAGLVALGTAEAGDLPVTGEGVRMMWYPGRWAFRVGRVYSFGATYWDLAQIGIGSVGLGENVRASGNNSFAANLATTASGDESVALGNNGTASGDRAFAFNGFASGVGAVAIGSGAQATGDDAIALGPSSIASGLAAVTIGPSRASGSFGVAIGLQNLASRVFSVAIGKNARSSRQGSIVLGDGCATFSSDSVYATADNQFVARGCGGIRFYTSQNLSTGVFVAPGGGSWASISDRNLKEHFETVDGEDVLRRLQGVPVSTWNYLTQDDGIRHMGPMAQDFRAAFELGEDSTTINTIDMDGVTLAGVQALSVRTDRLTAENEALRAELTAMRARLDRLDGGGPGPVEAALPWLGGLALLGMAGAGLRRRRSAARAD